MRGRILQAASRFTGTSTVGVEASGQTVISLDNLYDFATDMGVVSVAGQILFYDALDREAGTLTLTAPLAADLPAGTEVKSYPYSVQRWAFVLPDSTDEIVDAVWAIIPHALSAFVGADGLREDDDREKVKIERDGNTFVVVDVLNRQPLLDPTTIPEGAITETKIEPGSITTPLLASNAVATQHLQAGSVKGVTIDGDALNGKVITGALVRSAATGRRVEMSAAGIVQISDDGTVLLSIGDQNKFTGEVDATSMIIRDSLQLFGKNNLFGIGSKVTLKASAAAPSQSPTLSWDYEQMGSYSPGWFVTGVAGRSGYTSKSYTALFLGLGEMHSPSGGKWTFPAMPGNPDQSEFKPWTMIRIAKADTGAERVVMLGEDQNHIGTNGYPETWMRVYDDSGLVSDGSVAPVLKSQMKMWDFSWFKQYRLIRTVKGTGSRASFSLLEINAPLGGGNRTMIIGNFSWNNGDNVPPTYTGGYNFGEILFSDEDLAGGVFGARSSLGLAGSGDALIVNTTQRNLVFNSSYIYESASDFPPTYNKQDRTWSEGDPVAGTHTALYSNNWAAGSDAKVYRYAANHSNTAQDPIWGTYVWRGEASTSYRTPSAPRVSIAYRKMARLRVTIPSLPAPIAGVGAARDATKDIYGWTYFLGQGSTDPGNSAVFQQANTPALSPNTALAVSSVYLTTPPVLSGTIPPTSSTFPAAAPATIESDNGTLKITGDGDIWAREFFGTAVDRLLDLILPPGVIIETSDDVAPYRTALCNGAAVARTGTYAALFGKIGTLYGAGNGSTTFNLPNRNNRVGLGAGVKVLGATGGAETVQLTAAQSGQPLTNSVYQLNGGGYFFNVGSDGDGTHRAGLNGPVGASQAHENMPPYIALNYYIRY